MLEVQRRVRRSKEESQQRIMDAAESLLRKGGLDAVTMRAVAARVGITDAAINHHFGNRDDLLQALLRHGGRKLKAELNAALAQWDGGSLECLVDAIADLYADGAFAELALRLHMSGWRDSGDGLLKPAVDALHTAHLNACAAAGRLAPSLRETQFMLGLLHQVAALDPLFGDAFRRSAGLTQADAPSHSEKKSYWVAMLQGLGFDLRQTTNLSDD